MHQARTARRVDRRSLNAAEDAGLVVQGMGSIKNAVSADNRAPGLSPKFPAAVSATCLNPKLLDPGDANAGGDLGKRYARQVGVLATCRCPARHLAVR